MSTASGRESKSSEPGAEAALPRISASALRRANGERGARKYVAYDGFVYDVSDCPKWRTEMHENLHWPGQDLSGEMDPVHHQEEVFDRPCVKRVGILE